MAGTVSAPRKPHTEGHVRAILRRRDFRRLLVTRAGSQLADGFFQAGLAVSVFFNPTTQVEPVAYALAFTMLIGPYSLLGPYVGVFLDRWSRRDILAVSNTARAVLVIPTVFLIWLGQPEWQWAIFAMLVITINRFVLAGLSASQPHTVEPRELVTANAFAVTMGTICYGLGLGAAYLVIQLLGNDAIGNAGAAAVAIPLYGFSAAVARLSFARQGLGPDDRERVTGAVLAQIVAVSKGMVNGFTHLWERRGAAYIVLVQSGHRMLYGFLAVMTLAVFREYYHDPIAHPDYADTLAWLAAIAAAGQVGSFLSALVTPRMSRWIGPRTWVWALLCLLVVVLTSIGLGMVEQAFVIATFLVNITSQGIKIVVDTSIQSTIDDEYRGRIFSVNDTVFNVSFIVGMFLCVTILPQDGYAPWIPFFTAGGYVLLATWYRVVSRRFAPYVNA